MGKESSVRFNQTGLQVLASGLKKLDDGKFRIQVGLFGDKSARPKDKRAGPTNAEIGIVQEMGDVGRHIPRRSFLWDTFTLHGKELEAEVKEKKLVARFFETGKVDEYLKLVGVACTNLVVKAFKTGGFGAWKPNAPATIAAKKSDKPLISTGQLWQAISSRTVKA
jgi:hypothetical protein